MQTVTLLLQEREREPAGDRGDRDLTSERGADVTLKTSCKRGADVNKANGKGHVEIVTYFWSVDSSHIRSRAGKGQARP